jgi:hypothetical protein
VTPKKLAEGKLVHETAPVQEGSQCNLSSISKVEMEQSDDANIRPATLHNQSMPVRAESKFPFRSVLITETSQEDEDFNGGALIPSDKKMAVADSTKESAGKDDKYVNLKKTKWRFFVLFLTSLLQFAG